MQPSFWCVANIGDADPLNNGGAFVLVDRRGNYCPELWILEPVGEDSYGDPTEWKLAQLLMEPCTRTLTGPGKFHVSDNRYHPDKPSWFGGFDDLCSIASFVGESAEKLALSLCGNLLERATAWKAVHDYHGPQSEEETLNKRSAKALCSRMLRQIEASGSWHDGAGASMNKR